MARRRYDSFFFAFLTFLSIFITLSECIEDTRKCYNYKNEEKTEHAPCISPETQEISHCCAANHICLGDTLCMSPFGTMYVGSCTIRNWINGVNGADDCPKYCASGLLDGNQPDIGLCNFTKSGGWTFCCNPIQGIEACCAGDTFTIGSTTNEYLDQRPWLSEEVKSNSTNEGAPQQSGSANEEQTNEQNGQQNGENNGEQSGSGKKDNNAEIGIGVGLGIPLIIAVALLIWENRRRRIAEGKLKSTGLVPEKVHSADNNATYYGGQTYRYEVEAPPSEMRASDKANVHEIGGERHL